LTTATTHINTVVQWHTGCKLCKLSLTYKPSITDIPAKKKHLK